MPVPSGAFDKQIKLLRPMTEYAQPMERREFMPGMFNWHAVPNPPEFITFPANTVFSQIHATPSNCSVGHPDTNVYGTSDPIHGVRYRLKIGKDADFANARTNEDYLGYFLGGKTRRNKRMSRRKSRSRSRK
jgi:hypothetical protein